MNNIPELKKEAPTKAGKYLMRKPGMKHLFLVEIKIIDNQLYISEEPAYGGYGGMVVIQDYPLQNCVEGTEWMTEKEAEKYSWFN